MSEVTYNFVDLNVSTNLTETFFCELRETCKPKKLESKISKKIVTKKCNKIYFLKKIMSPVMFVNL